MAVYTVHQPPLKKYEAAPDPERFAFVRDGFSFWAFLFGPLWMLRHRMWLVLVGYIVIVVAHACRLALCRRVDRRFGLRVVHAGAAGRHGGGNAAAFHARPSQWRNVGMIVGDDRETAERRFFNSWVRGETLSPIAPRSRERRAAGAAARAASAAPDVIGLFPQQPGAHR